jgi:hypothetical protein
VSVQLGVLEVFRRVGIDEDTRRAVVDHEVAFRRFVLDGVVPGLVDRRMRAGGDSESCSWAGILCNHESDDGTDGFRREREHARSMAVRPLRPAFLTATVPRRFGTKGGLYSNAVGALDTIKQWFRKAGNEAETVAEGGEPDATPPDGGFGEPERETSTNAQTQGASDEPWSE